MTIVDIASSSASTSNICSSKATEKILACNKCKTTTRVLAMKQFHYCERCFLLNIETKFRTALGGLSYRNEDDNVEIQPGRSLLCYSGGLSSRLLIHLCQSYQQYVRSRSGQQGSPLFHQDFRVIHVLDGMEHDDDDDDLPTTPSCDLTPQRNSPTERETTVRNQLALDFNLQPSQICVVALPPFPPALRLQLTASAAESLRHHARQKLICLKAKQLGCSYVLLGDQAATCAQRILLETAQGRGLNLPLACAPVSPLHGIKVMRPLRLLVPQEVEAYCRLRQLNASSTCCQQRSVLQGSLEEATQEFIQQLIQPPAASPPPSQDHAVATLSTLVRTVSKLKVNHEGWSQRCVLCFSPIDSDAHEWRQRITVGAEQEVHAVGKDLLCFACLSDCNEGPVGLVDSVLAWLTQLEIK